MTQGRFDIEGVHTDDGQVSKKTLDYNRTHAFLAEDLWPCRQNMWLTEDYAASTRVELLEHPHRQIVGVRVRLSVVGHGLKDHVWWFDREHSYVPVERTSEIDQVFPDGSRKTQMHEVRFVDFARLPNDIWFVTRWERPKRDLDGRLLSTIVYEMQVFPEIDLDTDWFSPPKERLNSLLEVNQRR